MAKQQHITWSLTIALALTVMLGPFSTDTYLPAFPQMAEALGVDISKIALTISVYILTMSIGLLIGGPLSDNFGRRMVLVTGLFITLFASFAVGMSNSIGAVLFFRVLHAFGAGWVLVSVPAMIRDRVSGQEAAKLFSMIGLIMVIAPAIAPAVGSTILEIASWRWIFFFISVYALLLILIAWSIIFAHMPPRVGPRKVANLMDGYLAVIRERRSWPFILWQSACFSVIMVFVTQASYIYQDHFGLSPSRFSLLFAANIAAMLGFNLINRILLQSVRSIRILRFAT
ncbi:MAG: MFS transporter, partial [Puniceicoccaceae bacterium]